MYEYGKKAEFKFKIGTNCEFELKSNRKFNLGHLKSIGWGLGVGLLDKVTCGDRYTRPIQYKYVLSICLLVTGYQYSRCFLEWGIILQMLRIFNQFEQTKE